MWHIYVNKWAFEAIVIGFIQGKYPLDNLWSVYIEIWMKPFDFVPGFSIIKVSNFTFKVQNADFRKLEIKITKEMHLQWLWEPHKILGQI